MSNPGLTSESLVGVLTGVNVSLSGDIPEPWGRPTRFSRLRMWPDGVTRSMVVVVARRLTLLLVLLGAVAPVTALAASRHGSAPVTSPRGRSTPAVTIRVGAKKVAIPNDTGRHGTCRNVPAVHLKARVPAIVLISGVRATRVVLFYPAHGRVYVDRVLRRLGKGWRLPSKAGRGVADLSVHWRDFGLADFPFCFA
jgi:hypothetical protein